MKVEKEEIKVAGSKERKEKGKLKERKGGVMRRLVNKMDKKTKNREGRKQTSKLKWENRKEVKKAGLVSSEGNEETCPGFRFRKWFSARWVVLASFFSPAPAAAQPGLLLPSSSFLLSFLFLRSSDADACFQGKAMCATDTAVQFNICEIPFVSPNRTLV